MTSPNDLLEAERILTDVGVPLHVTDLAARIHGRGWEEVRADALDAMLAARIAVTIRREGARSPFRRVAPCVYALQAAGVASCGASPRARSLSLGPLAARAVCSARDEAIAERAEEIEIGHLLSGVASVDEGEAAEVLDALHVDRALLRERLRDARRAARHRPGAGGAP